MIAPRSVTEQLGSFPVPLEFFEILHNISMYLIMDDASDLGRFKYRDRDDHYYRGKRSPHHDSMIHHWQLGVLGLFASQIGSLMSVGMQVFNDYKKTETGDMSDIDSDVLELLDEDNTIITMDEYKEEVCDLEVLTPLEIPPMPTLLGM